MRALSENQTACWRGATPSGARVCEFCPYGVAFCGQFYQRSWTLRVLPVCTVARLVVPWYVAMTL
ncbi:hypothetical protein LMG19087_00022 [Ralstonia wenshanensis]|nr:hypothetical protein LMG19087_00022 [Ralstonia wenshanensis]